MRKPVLDKQLIPEKDVPEFEGCFFDVFNVLKHNEAFLERLVEARAASDSIVVQAVSRFVIEVLPSLEDPYIRYCSSYHANMQSLTRLRQQHPALDAYLNQVSGNPASTCKIPWEMMLSLPLQRISKYHLIFTKICQYTSKEHEDYAESCAALAKVLSILKNMDSIRGLQAEMEQLKMLERELSFKQALSVDGKKRKNVSFNEE